MWYGVRLWLILAFWPLFRDLVLGQQYAALWCVTKTCTMCDAMLCKEASFCWRCGILQMKAVKKKERDTDPLPAFDRWETLPMYGVRLNGRRPVEAYYQDKVEGQTDG